MTQTHPGLTKLPNEIATDLDGTLMDDDVEELDPSRDFSGYSGGGGEPKMAHDENRRGGHKTGAFTDIGEGRSGITTTRKGKR